jgi:hypothetical protein
MSQDMDIADFAAARLMGLPLIWDVSTMPPQPFLVLCDGIEVKDCFYYNIRLGEAKRVGIYLVKTATNPQGIPQRFEETVRGKITIKLVDNAMP